MYRSKPCLPYFTTVVKNVASPNIEIKKLVYIYILHYAESEPDLALLSINAIQKSLSDSNPQIRAMALRVMSGIGVPVISQIVSLAIKKGCGDMSPHVRKAAALSIPKCYKLDPSTLPQLLEYLGTLLGDRQYFVVGSAVTAFLEVCPDRIDLIHSHYRSLVKKLIDMDEWGQLALINLMTSYARKCLPRRTANKKGKSRATSYDHDSSQQGHPLDNDPVILDLDLKLFLDACRPLLNSRNAAVVIAVSRSFIHLGTPEYVDLTAGPLVALLRSPYDSHEVIFYNIVGVCLSRPQAFVPFLSHFLVKASDSVGLLQLKLELLTLLFPLCDEGARDLILNELEHFTESDDEVLVRESVKAIGRCAEKNAKTSSQCMNLLLQQATSSDDILVAEAVNVVRQLIQRDPSYKDLTIIRLAKNLDSIVNSEARASIIWLVGEYSNDDEQQDIAPDVLRILLQNFAEEEEPAKLQIITLAAKVYLRHLNRVAAASTDATDEDKRMTVTAEQSQENVEDALLEQQLPEEDATPQHPIKKLWDYLVLLVRYDVSYDLRDRMRMYSELLGDPNSTQLANLILFAPKPAPHVPSPSESQRNFVLGSASLVLGSESGPQGLHGYDALPDWVMEGEEPDPALRNPGEARSNEADANVRPAADILDRTSIRSSGVVQTAVSSAKKAKTLDDWLAEDDEKVETSEEEEEEYETEEEGSTEYETESEEGEEGESEGDEEEAKNQLLAK